MGAVRSRSEDSDGTVEALAALYRKGYTMEYIAEAMELPLVYVSQIVHALGLGVERYGVKHIPSVGSVSVVIAASSQGVHSRSCYKALNRGGGVLG